MCTNEVPALAALTSPNGRNQNQKSHFFSAAPPRPGSRYRNIRIDASLYHADHASRPVHQLHNSKLISLAIVSVSPFSHPQTSKIPIHYFMAFAGIAILQIKQAYPRSLELIPREGYWLFLDLYGGRVCEWEGKGREERVKRWFLKQAGCESLSLCAATDKQAVPVWVARPQPRYPQHTHVTSQSPLTAILGAGLTFTLSTFTWQRMSLDHHLLDT